MGQVLEGANPTFNIGQGHFLEASDTEPAAIKVTADGKNVYDAPPPRPGQPPVSINIDLSGTRRLIEADPVIPLGTQSHPAR